MWFASGRDLLRSGGGIVLTHYLQHILSFPGRKRSTPIGVLRRADLLRSQADVVLTQKNVWFFQIRLRHEIYSGGGNPVGGPLMTWRPDLLFTTLSAILLAEEIYSGRSKPLLGPCPRDRKHSVALCEENKVTRQAERSVFPMNNSACGQHRLDWAVQTAARASTPPGEGWSRMQRSRRDKTANMKGRSGTSVRIRLPRTL